VIWYDWLADSVTTSHVTNQRLVLVDYRPANGTSVVGISNVSTNMEGCRSVMLQTKCGDRAYNLKLDNVLYIPSNHNSLISLGRWEQHGQSYEVRGGQLMLKTAMNEVVAVGKRIKNNLYRMDVQLAERNNPEGMDVMSQ
ncbi:hypothetical protein V8E53_007875, partial [Lactarius tabidus]